jgi:hypothetical protein
MKFPRKIKKKIKLKIKSELEIGYKVRVWFFKVRDSDSKNFRFTFDSRICLKKKNKK